jgi:hypothetical protein
MSDTSATPYALPARQGWTYNAGPDWTYNFDVDFVVKLGERGQGRRLAIVEYTTRAGEDHAAFWAAGLWQRAFDAKIRSLDGDPDQILTRHEASDRLYRAGLNPDLAAEGRQCC